MSISTVTNMYLCLCVCVSFRLSTAHALSSVVAFCHLCAGLPVLLLCVLAAVHPNMALLPTGTTSVRSASTRSRGTVWPWGTTRHSHRRKLQGPSSRPSPDDHLASLSGCFLCGLHSVETFNHRSQHELVVSLFFVQHDIKRAVWKEEKWHVGLWTVSTVWTVTSV